MNERLEGGGGGGGESCAPPCAFPHVDHVERVLATSGINCNTTPSLAGTEFSSSSPKSLTSLSGFACINAIADLPVTSETPLLVCVYQCASSNIKPLYLCWMQAIRS